MTSEEIGQICAERLLEWGEKLTANHATPLFLIGIGQDDHEGELHVCLADMLPIEDLKTVLLMALDKIEWGI